MAGKTPLYALANIFWPNLIKLKGAATCVSMMETKDTGFFAPLWTQAQVAHKPAFTTATRESSVSQGTYRFGVISLPPPKDMGDAYLAAIALKKQDPHFVKIYTLEHDFVLAKGTTRTQLVERDGSRQVKHGEGPVLGRDDHANGVALIDAIMNLLEPKKLEKR